jgi:hypothetical protein
MSKFLQSFIYQSIGLNELIRMVYEKFSVTLSIKSYGTYGDTNMLGSPFTKDMKFF